METLPAAPTATLSNGIGVANFGSPHAFTFDDGTVLDAADQLRVAASAMKRTSRFDEFPGIDDRVQLESPAFYMPDELYDELEDVSNYAGVHIVLVRRILIDAVRATGRLEEFLKIATGSLSSRKRETLHINRFCR